MVFHVVDQLRHAGAKRIVVVVDHPSSEVAVRLTEEFGTKVISFAVQREALGTGDAARRGLNELKGEKGRVVIVPGDVPLLRSETLKKLQRASKRSVVNVLTTTLADPDGYGRIVRRGNRVAAIVEHRDATPAERDIREVNVGVYDVELAFLRKTLSKLKRDNSQGEFYLTDIVAAGSDHGVGTYCVSDDTECRGANDKGQLADLESLLRHRLITEHQKQGVTFEVPDSVVIEATVRLAPDVVIGPGVQLRGATEIDESSVVEGPSVLIDAVIESDVRIRSFSHLESVSVGAGAEVGPYARLRPGTVLDPSSKV
ncbi:MAG: bifunctional UDP-N-acetylglucosamine diphosphorylase/glucosamine-1-phosphate N-acetyltransferase GlmU, partial [Halieaceae bacterium]|nr:bifunctional UDP-N-acetylglucosamine diphosphorylase/glucosamine-1-phosphate N-acetyltransferase GlmU [Halieaceae bacterium]